MRYTWRSVFLGILSTAVFAGVTVSVQAATLVYVGNADSNDIHVLRLDPLNGDLAPVETVTIPGITKAGGSTPLAISPDKRFLHAAMRGEPMIAASFRIDPTTGKLAHAGSGPLADSMAYIVTDRSGKFLLSASYPGHKVTVNPIGPDGVVQAPSQIVATEPNAHAILPDRSNRHVLVTSLGGDIVKQFRFDAASGTLSPNAPASVSVKEKAGPRHFRFHPNEKFVYLLNELDASVTVFDYDAGKGTLSQKQTVSALPATRPEKIWAADLHLTPDGKFLYASERGTSTLAGFKVDPANGMLTLIDHTPTEQQPRGFAIDLSGRYLLAVGQLSHAMTSYKIEPGTGHLTKLKGYPMGKNPNWVEIIDLP